MFEALAQVAVDRYPDSRSAALAERLAVRHNVGPEQVLVGNGSTELIRLLALAYLDPGDCCLIAGPTYGEYRAAATLATARVEEVRAPEEGGFAPDVAALAAQVRSSRPRLTFLCNPNNPTGSYLGREAVSYLAEACADGMLVVDQAYRPFVAEPWPAEPLLACGNVVLLHSLTKAEALAGLRLGYLLAPAPVVALLQRIQGPWSVNAAAQAAGLAALDDAGHLQRTLGWLARGKAYLVAGLSALGLRPVLTATHYMLVPVGDGAATRAALLRHRLLVRDCASFGLPAYIRIATRRPEENALLLEALAAEQRGKAKR